MSRKDYVSAIIENLEKHSDLMTPQLRGLLSEVKNNLQTMSEEGFLQRTDGVVTQPASEQTVDAKAPLIQLAGVQDELKRLADANEAVRPELKSAVAQLEGLIGSSESYFPE
ncbi:hypothetical protein [Brevibacillus migulae]|uniref:hypothetical protein n=1 Tax=Brevibacillus migulae TaxID=1644114 RepID=UPI00106E04A3|nr:hypothetical protein [Brevibacillus migulae]